MTMRPFRGRGFYDLHSEMNRMFDEVFGGMATFGLRDAKDRRAD